MKFPGKNLSTVNVGAAYSPAALPKYHWIPDPPDPRDHIYQGPPELTAAKLPASVDLRQYASPIDDQGNLGSCTGNSIAGAIDLIDKKTQNKALRVSRLFIYYQERVLEGDVYYDNGAYIRDGIKACYTYGAPQETTWPYTLSKWATRPSSAAYSEALTRKVTGYAKCTDLTAIKTALAAGTPVVVGFTVYSSFEQGAWQLPGGSGLMPYPNINTESVLGGHAVCVVGYNDALAGGRLIVRNSWGTSWADNGYFYMPYQVIQNTNMSSDFWTISGVHNP
jgi:C1A family cysteine protease